MHKNKCPQSKVFKELIKLYSTKTLGELSKLYNIVKIFKEI